MKIDHQQIYREKMETRSIMLSMPHQSCTEDIHWTLAYDGGLLGVYHDEWEDKYDSFTIFPSSDTTPEELFDETFPLVMDLRVMVWGYGSEAPDDLLHAIQQLVAQNFPLVYHDNLVQLIRAELTAEMLCGELSDWEDDLDDARTEEEYGSHPHYSVDTIESIMESIREQLQECSSIRNSVGQTYESQTGKIFCWRPI